MFRGFKNFLMQGQLVVVAVGLSIALAFSVLVQTFTGTIITPLVNAAGGGGANGLGVRVNGQLLDFGSLISAIVYFIVFVAVVYFAIVVPYRAYQQRRGVAVFTEPPPTKACPACLSDGLPLEATKCRYCSTELTVEQSGGLAEPA
ncbi:MAG TPA: MscL family protein [Gaiellaceae bacterium]|jgi:large conductance mechanosensitive channel